MDLLARYYKSMLTDLRMIELKAILSQIGTSKQGIKQDLVDRILLFFQEERKIEKHDVANLIDETHRKLYPDGISRGAVLPEDSNVDPQDQKIRCVCGIKSKSKGIMIKCEDPSCGVWQHQSCVLIPEKPNSTAASPEPFYCELCRLSRADPFCITLPTFPLRSVKLPATQSISRTFVISGENKVRMSKKECDVQAWCMLLNDKVRFRVQWPKHVDLKVNGIQMKPTNRFGSMMLGANGRDNGVVISQFIKVGINNITMDAKDSRVFCLGVRFVERRTVKQVMEMIPGESEGENLEDAVARVTRCVGGGGDHDGDLQLVSDCIPVNLRCPMSGSRIKVAGRFNRCVHMGCFDLEVFVEMSMRSKKWQCPICLKNYCLSDLIIDPYFNRIAAKLRNLGQDVNEVEVRPDGSWRAKSGSNGDHLGALALWHAPDGLLCMHMVIRQVEQAHGSEVRNSAMKRNEVVTAKGDDLGDAKVIVLSDSEENENESVASNVLVGASVKRASERSDSRFSVPYKRRLVRRMPREYISIDSD